MRQLLVDISANAFLHHMVRNIAGVLMDIGSGIKPEDWPNQLLEVRDRSKASITAPPHGLFLVQVDYPSFESLPKGPQLPHFLAGLSIGLPIS